MTDLSALIPHEWQSFAIENLDKQKVQSNILSEGQRFARLNDERAHLLEHSLISNRIFTPDCFREAEIVQQRAKECNTFWESARTYIGSVSILNLVVGKEDMPLQDRPSAAEALVKKLEKKKCTHTWTTLCCRSCALGLRSTPLSLQRRRRLGRVGPD